MVQRTHLIEKLNRDSDRKLTLISAPAGFGKTTLLSEWISDSEIPVAWISLDKDDNDPVYFIHYLIAALQKFDSNIGKPTFAMLRSPQQLPIESIMTSLIKEISEIPNKCTLALDDYHCVDNKRIHSIVEFLLDYMPTKLRLVIATRIDPPLPLARMRAGNQLNELRTADLSFTYDEVSQFLKKVMNLGISIRDISLLKSRTEGWIAGLQLAALSMQGRKDIPEFIKTFAGDNRHIIDYLTEEVLNLKTEQVQRFLLQTSILKRLSGSLCDFVTGQKNGQEMLVNLEKANLFILPLDNKRRWYRYHHLFADLLRQRLHQTHSVRLHELHNRASEWYEHNELREEAIEHALMAEDFKRAARLVEELAEAMWKRSEPARLFRWLEALPDKYVISSPNLCIIYAWVLCDNGQQQAAERSLRTAERILDSINNENTVKPRGESKRQPSLTNRDLKGRIAAVRAYMATGGGRTKYR